MKRFIARLAVALIVLTMARSASASTVSLSLTSANGSVVTVTPSAGGGENTTAGPYGFHISSSTDTTTVPNGDYLGFCIALTETIRFDDPKTFQVESLATDLVGENPGNPARGQIQAENILALFKDYATAGGDPIHPVAGVLSDALTVAIWDVLDATSHSLQIGAANNISVSWGDDTNPTVHQANTWLASLFTDVHPSLASQYADANVYALDNVDETQDQSIVIGFTNQIPAPVPEPSSLLCMTGLGLLGMAFGLVGRARRMRGRTAR